MKIVFATLRSFQPLLLLFGMIWVAHLVNIAIAGALSETFGLTPRRLSGLDGIIGMPFLHADFEHLIANTAPLLWLGTLIIFFAKGRFMHATIIIWLLSGVLLWLFGRAFNHIGASGLLFGWFGFLIAFGFAQRSWRAIVGAVFALSLHGASMLAGLIPTELSMAAADDARAAVSWEAHIFGFAAGVVAAFALRTKPHSKRTILRPGTS
jgi:membrane associated rhomboid family serine protease